MEITLLLVVLQEIGRSGKGVPFEAAGVAVTERVCPRLSVRALPDGPDRATEATGKRTVGSPPLVYWSAPPSKDCRNTPVDIWRTSPVGRPRPPAGPFWLTYRSYSGSATPKVLPRLIPEVML